MGETAAGLGRVIATAVSIGYGGSILCWWRVSSILKKRSVKALKGFIVTPTDPEDQAFDQDKEPCTDEGVRMTIDEEEADTKGVFVCPEGETCDILPTATDEDE
jgi:hypothetical protein